MKQFAVELSRTSYITIHVEAQDEDDAETVAWREIDHDGEAHWEITDITEQHIPTNVKETT